MSKTRKTRKTTRGKGASQRVPRRRTPHRHEQPSPRPFAQSDWGDAHDAATYTGHSAEFIRHQARLGIIPSYAVKGESRDNNSRDESARRKPRLRFRRQDLDAWLMAGRVSVKLAEVHPRTPATEATV